MYPDMNTGKALIKTYLVVVSSDGRKLNDQCNEKLIEITIRPLIARFQHCVSHQYSPYNLWVFIDPVNIPRSKKINEVAKRV